MSLESKWFNIFESKFINFGETDENIGDETEISELNLNSIN